MIDTLRHDHLGTYGYSRSTSPTIDDLAAESVLFEAAYAQASWTRPSVGSLFTGLLPRKHGAVRRENALRTDVKTMAELFALAGYRGSGFISNPNVLAEFGFDRGFESYLDLESVSVDTDARQLHEAALRQLARFDGPQFLYVHTIDPHVPYEPPEPFASLFEASPIPPQHDHPMPETVSKTINLYDGEIAYADAALGDFIGELKERGLWGETLFILLSDHGEEFWDHESIQHGTTLYEEQIRVPLLVRFPGAIFGGSRVPSRVRVIDILPSLLEHLGEAIPANLDGSSFLNLVRGNLETATRPVFSELNMGKQAISSLMEGPLKLILQRGPEERQATMLYNLSLDPSEEHDLSVRNPKATRELADRIAEIDRSLERGIHIEFVNSKKQDSATRMLVRIQVESGAFRGVEWSDFEAGDRVILSDDEKSMNIELDLKNRDNPTGGQPFLLIDVDRIRFEVESPNAWVNVSVEIDGERLDSTLLLAGQAELPKKIPLPWHVQIDSDELHLGGVGLRAPVRSPEPYIRVYQVPESSHPTVTLDPLLDARLRALGYVE
ncbi:MAG: sulfatase-like hydrolase/transferase [Myxococcota bacterium]|nr:sulfatase-like hydrolase/transferase [Myxococcota bacterium]